MSPCLLHLKAQISSIALRPPPSCDTARPFWLISSSPFHHASPPPSTTIPPPPKTLFARAAAHPDLRALSRPAIRHFAAPQLRPARGQGLASHAHNHHHSRSAPSTLDATIRLLSRFRCHWHPRLLPPAVFATSPPSWIPAREVEAAPTTRATLCASCTSRLTRLHPTRRSRAC